MSDCKTTSLTCILQVRNETDIGELTIVLLPSVDIRTVNKKHGMELIFINGGRDFLRIFYSSHITKKRRERSKLFSE